MCQPEFPNGLPVLTIRIAIRALDDNSGADGDGQIAPLAAGIGADAGVIALIASFHVINEYLSGKGSPWQ